MKKIVSGFLIFIAVCAVFSGAVSATEWTPVTVTDANGDRITITEYPTKIISLAPANTEIIYAVGAGDRLVGDTTYCNYPEAAKSVEKIGEFSVINRERIIALSDGPTVIFANPNNGKDTIRYLRDQGLTVIVVNPDSIDAVYSSIAMIGDAVGNRAEADKVVTEMKVGIKQITDKLAGATTKPTIMHAMSVDPFYVSGSKTFQNELFELAGAANAFADVEGWSAVTLEKLLVADPQIIVTDPGADMGTAGYDSLRESFSTEPRLSTLSAVKNDKVSVIDADIFDRGGPRVVEALQQLVKITHPEIFGEASAPASTQQSPGFGIAAGLAGILGAVLLFKRRA
ncbi:MAG TPA: helical backbone metal receptor [Methanocorpusculum sp.]|nr:helical backbone metal receptor [Methanocorpusculum sp.]